MRISKIISLLVIAAFLSNSVFCEIPSGQSVNLNSRNSDNLAPPLALDDIGEGSSFIQYLTVVKMALLMGLEMVDKRFGLEGATDNRAIKELFLKDEHLRSARSHKLNNVFMPVYVRSYYNEVEPANPNYFSHIFVIPVATEITGKQYRYRLLFSTIRNREGRFPVMLCTAESLEQAREAIALHDRLPAVKSAVRFSPSGIGTDARPKNSKPPSILEAAKINIESAAGIMGLDPYLKELILKPKRVTQVSFELSLDSGKKVKFWAFRALQNDALGPGKGGLRWLVGSGETLDEAKNTAVGLATLMTIKNSLIGIPYGGGKGDIFVKNMIYTDNDKDRIVRAFSRALTEQDAIGTFIDVPAPDQGTDAHMMAVFLDEHIYVRTRMKKIYDKTMERGLDKVKPSSNPKETPHLDRFIQMLNDDEAGALQGYELGMVTGKPVGKGGSEGRTKATGLGGFLALKAMLRHFSSIDDLKEDIIGKTLNDRVRSILKTDLKSMTAAVQGTGNVGEYHAWELYRAGVKITMLEDAVLEDGRRVKYTLYNFAGIDLGLLNKNLTRGSDGRWASIKTIPEEFFERTGCRLLRGDEKFFWATHTDIKVPGATQNVITSANAGDVNCEILLELANDPIAPDADKILKKRGILMIPDVLANAGGVTVSYYEWLQNIEGNYWAEVTVDKRLEERINIEVGMALSFAERYQTDLRNASYILSLARIADAEIARSDELTKKFHGKNPYKYYGKLGLSPLTVEGLSRIIREGRYAKFVREAEDVKSYEIGDVVEEAIKKLPLDEVGFILISGPTTSGKLGLAVNLVDRLRAKGRRAVRLNYDALTVDDLKKLLRGESVEAVDYIFGNKIKRTVSPQKGDIIVVEGDHALRGDVLNAIPEKNRYLKWVNTMPSMKLADNWPLMSLDLRLLRHILTMHHTEGKKAIDVIREWPVQRKIQIRDVDPTCANAGAMFNGYLPYELPIIKYCVEGFIREAKETAVRDGDKASIKIIERLERTLKDVISVEDKDMVPKDSIAQQYIGNGGFYDRLMTEEPFGNTARLSSSGWVAAILDELPKQILENGLDLKDSLIPKIGDLLQCHFAVDDDKAGFIFSKNAAYGWRDGDTIQPGLAVLLPKLANAGMKIAVVANTEEQKAIVDELNAKVRDRDNHIRAICGPEYAHEAMKLSRYYYFIAGDDKHIDINNITTQDITRFVKRIIDIIGEVCGITKDSQELKKVHELALRFAQAA